MNAVYVCPAGQLMKVNVYGFKKSPQTLKLRGSWYFEECIKCKIPTSDDYYLREGDCFQENGVECESYCELKLRETTQ